MANNNIPVLYTKKIYVEGEKGSQIPYFTFSVENDQVSIVDGNTGNSLFSVDKDNTLSVSNINGTSLFVSNINLDGLSTAIRVNGDNNETTLLRTSIDANTNSTNYGFSIKYMGNRSGNNNSLSIFSDNQQASTQIEALTVLQNGYIGIGRNSPGSPLEVKGGSNDGNGGIRIRSQDALSYWNLNVGNGGDDLYFSAQGTNEAYIANGGGTYVIVFTGQHRNMSDELLDNSSTGLIVVSTGVYDNLDRDTGPTINESLPKVKLSNQRNQKSAFGVISNKEDANEGREFANGSFVTVKHITQEDERLIINSVGEGGIWVCNINGNLENGDYITTCEVPGYGMKQDDDLLHNYTVAKITCDCDFNLQSPIYICEEFEFEGQIYRKAFVGCTYHCG